MPTPQEIYQQWLANGGQQEWLRRAQLQQAQLQQAMQQPVAPNQQMQRFGQQAPTAEQVAAYQDRYRQAFATAQAAQRQIAAEQGPTGNVGLDGQRAMMARAAMMAGQPPPVAPTAQADALQQQMAMRQQQMAMRDARNRESEARIMAQKQAAHPEAAARMEALRQQMAQQRMSSGSQAEQTRNQLREQYARRPQGDARYQQWQQMLQSQGQTGAQLPGAQPPAPDMSQTPSMTQPKSPFRGMMNGSTYTPVKR